MFTLIIPHFLLQNHANLPIFNTSSLNQILRFSRWRAHSHKTSTLYYQYLAQQLPNITNTAFVSPISQQLGMNTTLLLDSHNFPISQQEAETIIDGLNNFYQQDANFKIINAQLWQITLPQIDNWQIPAIWDVGGQMDSLLRSENQASKQWLQLNTEIQMWLYTHPINQQRQQQGLLPINSLWLWQPENTSSTPKNSFQLIGTNSIWKQYSQTPHQAMPNNLQQWQQLCLAKHININQTALFIEDFIAPTHQSNIWLYQQTIEQYEQNFFHPIWQAIKNKQINAIQIITEQGTFTLSHYAHYFFWKKSTNLSHIINQYANHHFS